MKRLALLSLFGILIGYYSTTTVCGSYIQCVPTITPTIMITPTNTPSPTDTVVSSNVQPVVTDIPFNPSGQCPSCGGYK